MTKLFDNLVWFLEQFGIESKSFPYGPNKEISEENRKIMNQPHTICVFVLRSVEAAKYWLQTDSRSIPHKRLIILVDEPVASEDITHVEYGKERRLRDFVYVDISAFISAKVDGNIDSDELKKRIPNWRIRCWWKCMRWCQRELSKRYFSGSDRTNRYSGIAEVVLDHIGTKIGLCFAEQ